MMAAPHYMMQSERRHVIYDCFVRPEHDPRNHSTAFGIVRERHFDPFVRDLL